MFESDYEMALSDEDLVVIIIAVIAFVMSFADVKTPDTIASFSFPSILIFLLSWLLVRFRRRPLPKQVHQTRFFYLGSIKVSKFYNLISTIFLNLLVFIRYYDTTPIARIAEIFNYIWLFFLLLIELFGHIFVSDTLVFIPAIEGEDQELLKRKRNQLLYGRRFWIWSIIMFLLTIGMLYVPLNSIFITGDPILIVGELLSLILAIGIVVWLYYRTMRFEKILPPELLIKAVDYYNSMKMQDYSIKLLEEYDSNNPTNVGVLSKLAVLYAERKEYAKVLSVTEKILAEAEAKGVRLPHILAKTHLLRAFALATEEKFQDAYDEVTKSLRYIPENNIARKLRRDLRKRLKMNELEKGAKGF